MGAFGYMYCLVGKIHFYMLGIVVRFLFRQVLFLALVDVLVVGRLRRKFGVFQHSLVFFDVRLLVFCCMLCCLFGIVLLG